MGISGSVKMKFEVWFKIKFKLCFEEVSHAFCWSFRYDIIDFNFFPIIG